MVENPLSQEQTDELNRIAKLPIEEQKVKLQEFLQKLTPQQIEFLKSQQGGQCVFCAIADGKISAKKIYEDDYLIGALDINPGNKGHVILFPKIHYEILGLMNDVGHLFNVANKVSSAVFDATNADGTNLFVANGLAAGQKMPHITVHIIPRFKSDKINFSWDKLEVSDKEMDSLAKEIRSKIVMVKKVKPEEKIEKIVDNSVEEQERVR